MSDVTPDTTPAPRPPKTAIPPLPKKADMDGASWARPTSVGLTVSMVLYLVVIALCTMLAMMGRATEEIVLGTLASVVFIVLWLVAWRFAKRFFSEYRDEALSAEERDYVARHPTAPDAMRLVRREKIGYMLVDGASGPRSASTSAVREEEAEKTWAWYERVGDPQIVHIDAEDGATLTGHVCLLDPKSRKWLLFMHGFRGHWTEGYLYARRYAERGYNIIMPEQRAHATSGGGWICMGGREGRDTVAWTKWLVKTYGRNIRIVLQGHSMGGAAVCVACGEKDLASQVRVTVEDCGYSDPWNVFVPIVHKGLHLAVHPLLDLMGFLVSRQEGGCDLAEIDVTTSVAHARTPLLALHGEADVFVPPLHGRRIYDAAGGAATGDDKRLVYFPGAGHCQSCLSDPERYFSELFGFVDRYM